jgi:DNA repair protein RadC
LQTEREEVKMNKFLDSDFFQMSSAAKAFEFLQPLRKAKVEEFWVLALSPSLRVLNSEMIFRGTVSSCMIHPREVFRFAIANGASGIIVSHNHPSGEIEASEIDIITTQQLIEAGKIIDVPVFDHLLITPHGFSSFLQKGWCLFS